MAEPFKDRINPTSITWLAERLSAAHPSFPRDRFEARARAGLGDLELKGRVGHVADALRAALPESWPDALDVLLAMLPPAPEGTDDLDAGFALWPVLTVVERYGLDHPERSVVALKSMTSRFSAEFAIRPYLLQHPERTWDLLERWVDDRDVHVRRWLSEGTRPRLPWGLRLTDAVTDPSRGLALLDALVDDPSEYVRRSVANHLNDVSKDHPERAVSTAARWLTDDPSRQRTVRHALRTRLKAGDPDALALLGYHAPDIGPVALSLDPDPARIGDTVVLTAEVPARSDQPWMVDWIIRSPRADGSLGKRVMKGSTRQASAQERCTIRHQLSLAPVTTRVTRPGEWRVDLQLNGVLVAEGRLTVEPA